MFVFTSFLSSFCTLHSVWRHDCECGIVYVGLCMWDFEHLTNGRLDIEDEILMTLVWSCEMCLFHGVYFLALNLSTLLFILSLSEKHLHVCHFILLTISYFFVLSQFFYPCCIDVFNLLKFLIFSSCFWYLFTIIWPACDSILYLNVYWLN